jgi:hypothetical protein
VTVADVNLKFMWEVITRIRAGDKGKAYVVDSAGYLDRRSRHRPRAAQDRPVGSRT